MTGDEYRLKRCPFCGGEAQLITLKPVLVGDIGETFVYCVQCGASTQSMQFSNGDGMYVAEARVAEMWNKRVHDCN